MTRAAQTRLRSARKSDLRKVPQNAHQSALYVPKHVWPPGMTYGWVSIATLNEPNHTNWAQKVRNGWTPVPRERHPDLFPSMPIPGFEDKASQYILVGNNTILCEKPTRLVEEAAAEKRRNNAEVIQQTAQWTGEQSGTFDGVTPKADFGSETGIERVTAMQRQAEFKE